MTAGIWSLMGEAPVGTYVHTHICKCCKFCGNIYPTLPCMSFANIYIRMYILEHNMSTRLVKWGGVEVSK